MTSQQDRKISRKVIALASTLLLFAAAALGFYNRPAAFETLLDRNMFHQCNGPKRGILLESSQVYTFASLPIGLFRLFYLTTPTSTNMFCTCNLSCEDGNPNLYMTDNEAYWVFPEFLNDWQPDRDYDCIAETTGNSAETCKIRGIGDSWYTYVMVRARTSLTNCTLKCTYAK